MPPVLPKCGRHRGTERLGDSRGPESEVLEVVEGTVDFVGKLSQTTPIYINTK